jgi:hypothetical protein
LRAFSKELLEKVDWLMDWLCFFEVPKVSPAPEVADFQAVAAGIFEKGGVVGFILPTRAFEVPSAGAGGDERESVEFGGVLHPECDPAFIRHVAGGFRYSKKGCRLGLRLRIATSRESYVLGFNE